MEFNNPSASVEVSVPYKPTAEELTKQEHIVVWYLDDKGVLTPVPSGKYDAGSGMVTFSTTHFSKYAVGFVVKVLPILRISIGLESLLKCWRPKVSLTGSLT